MRPGFLQRSHIPSVSAGLCPGRSMIEGVGMSKLNSRPGRSWTGGAYMSVCARMTCSRNRRDEPRDIEITATDQCKEVHLPFLYSL
jgi:hypothetical protein